MSEDRREEFLREDWSESWDELPEAPPLLPGPKTAQITLRLSPRLLARVRRVADAGSLPYHVLTRSWLIHAIRAKEAPRAQEDAGPHTAQLNIKLDEQAVDALKAWADQLRRPYHRLARECIAAAVAREEELLELDTVDEDQFVAGPQPRQAVSPYSTGGGGVTFERRVAVRYLAMLLTADTASELDDDREVRSVMFQQGPRVPVDDLVILAARPNEAEPSLELALGVRRKPKIVESDSNTQALMVEYLRALFTASAEGPERHLALAVAGTQPHAEQLAELADLARNQMDAPEFFSLLRTPKKFERKVVSRLTQVEGLVRNALPQVGVPDADRSTVARHVWELLRRLTVIMPKVEAPDTTDWDATKSQLRTVVRDDSVVAAGHLLNSLETLAAQYGPSAATVDRPMLRRRLHSLLKDGRSRGTGTWELLDHLQRQARGAVRSHVGAGGAGDRVQLDRSSEAQAVMTAAEAADALIVTGESGVGKSALVLGAVTAAEAASNRKAQAICLNLRHLPESSFELVAQLGCPLDRVLSDLSAPSRYLVVDGADAATEVRGQVFSTLVEAARNTGVRLLAITSAEAREVVKDLVTAQLTDGQVGEHVVNELGDAQLDHLVERFPKLARLAANPRSRELLRRLVVVDLLLRSEVSGVLLTEADAMRQIWERLVRREGRRDRGLPDAREQVMLRLALQELSRGPASEAAAALDPAAIDGLRRDGLLRTAPENPWQVIPDFSHDEIRRHAVARALLADGDPAAALLDAGAPRWAMSAGRLACQAMLDQPDRRGVPLRGRLPRLQQAFDRLVAAGHGARWADLPSEALLTLGDPRPVLTDAWANLRADDAAGFQRLLRLVDQRHREINGTIDPLVIEPVIALLLEEATPWRGSKDAARALREWLLGLVVRDAPADNQLRARLRHRLVAACAAADKELVADQEAAAAARAARTPEQIEQARKNAERNRWLFSEIGYGGRTRREQPAVPRALTDKTVLELLALLGPDLGEDGEHLLRRVARDAPWELAPAVEELGTGRALASYGQGLLGHLVEAYYLDEDEDGSGFHEDGVRDHRSRGPIAPLAAWYQGPFAALFPTDFRRGISVLNRLLNHAARARAQTLAGLGDRWGRPSEEAVTAYSVELRVTGTTKTYIGDPHVWCWYRGTGVGPYPCMSALQALERFCDQLLQAEISPSYLVPILMDGCENLAMAGLVVGILVRHLERAETTLDPFLSEPAVWQLEFSRAVSESGGLAASSEGLVAPERRTWSLREAATWLTLHAEPARAQGLRAVGDQLVARAVKIEQSPGFEQDAAGLTGEKDPAAAVTFSTTVRNWASTLDRSRYRAVTEDDITYIQSTPPEEVQAALEPGNQDLHRGQEVMRLFWRYFAGGALGRRKTEPPPDNELADDLAAAKELFDDPPIQSAIGVLDMAAVIAAHALQALLLRGLALPAEAEQFALSTVLAVAEDVTSPDDLEFEGSLFEQGADRSAARGLPLLMLPAAARLRAALGEQGGRSEDARVFAAGRNLARAVANETRLHLARGLDAVWDTPCNSGGRCHHELGLELAIESMRDCEFGGWDSSGQRRRIETLEVPVTATLPTVADDHIFVARLDAAIRATGAAAVRETCVQAEARALLLELLKAQRRGLLAHEQNFDARGSHALVGARSLLALASTDEDEPLRQHMTAYADNSSLLGSFLRALAAAAEEDPLAGQAARRLWPTVIKDVLELQEAGHEPFGDRYFGRSALAALMPQPTYEGSFDYFEVEAPINWTDPTGWARTIDEWVSVAAGEADCVDAMIGLVRPLPEADQVKFWLPRVATLVKGDPEAVARRSYLLTDWLKMIRAAAVDEGAASEWQEVVDTLVVAGNTSLAPYSD